MAVKTEQLQIRTSESQKSVLAEAARLRHMNVSQFVLGASLNAAEELLAERSRFVLGQAAFDEFLRRLDEPAREIPALADQITKARPRT